MLQNTLQHLFDAFLPPTHGCARSGRMLRRPYLKLKLYAALLLTLGQSAHLGAETKDDKRYWAYPDGVLTSIDTASASLRGRKVVAKDRLPLEDDVEEKIKELASRLNQSAKDCLVSHRQNTASPEGLPRYTMSNIFAIDAKGRASDLEQNYNAPARSLKCLKKLKDLILEAQLPLPPKGKVFDIRIDIRGVIFSDNEAKGRGYLYYERQTAWEKAIRNHREWFKCQASSECVPRLSGCSPKGVNKLHLQAYDEAHSLRSLPECRVKQPSQFKAECVRGRCIVK